MREITEEQAQDEAAWIIDMVKSNGWRVLMDEVNEMRKAQTKALITEPEREKVIRLQSQLQALDFVEQFPLTYVEAVKRATAQAVQAD